MLHEGVIAHLKNARFVGKGLGRPHHYCNYFRGIAVGIGQH
jgi:hypothetical protein